MTEVKTRPEDMRGHRQQTRGKGTPDLRWLVTYPPPLPSTPPGTARPLPALPCHAHARCGNRNPPLPPPLFFAPSPPPRLSPSLSLSLPPLAKKKRKKTHRVAAMVHHNPLVHQGYPVERCPPVYTLFPSLTLPPPRSSFLPLPPSLFSCSAGVQSSKKNKENIRTPLAQEGVTHKGRGGGGVVASPRVLQ